MNEFFEIVKMEESGAKKKAKKKVNQDQVYVSFENKDAF